jgi:hypothetical protein
MASGDEYYAHLNDSQTHQCTRLAAIYYNERNASPPIFMHSSSSCSYCCIITDHDHAPCDWQGVCLSNVQPEDSQAFSCSWTAPGDNRRCFHVTFKADVRPGATRFFFAEILGKGNGGPEAVQHCVKLGGPSSTYLQLLHIYTPSIYYYLQ